MPSETNIRGNPSHPPLTPPRQEGSSNTGNLQGRRAVIKRESPIPKSVIISMIFVAAVAITLIVLASMHIGGAPLLFSAVAITSAAVISDIFIAKWGVDRYKRFKRHETAFPEYYPQRREQQAGRAAQFMGNLSHYFHRQPRAEREDPSEPVAFPSEDIGVRREEWAIKLRNTQKTDANGQAYQEGPAYYDLSLDPESPRGQFAENLELGLHGKYLQIPHLGEYIEGNFCPDDHEMAVRLPALSAFPEEIQTKFRNHQNPELYFMVFKNQNQANNFYHNFSMHAMALPEYDHTDPMRQFESNRPPLASEVKKFQTTTGGKGLKLEGDLKIARYECDGIEDIENEGETIFLTQHEQTIHPIIHTLNRTESHQHLFSKNEARFKVAQQADVSSMFVSAEFRGRAVAFHAIILNNDESEEVQKVKDAIQTGSLEEFLNSLEENNFCYKDKVKRTFSLA